MEKDKTEEITNKIKSLIKKRKTPVIVIKAGSVKPPRNTSGSGGSFSDYNG